MLPFPTMNQFGNKVLKWYTGNEVIAYDSAIYDNKGFTDYTGKEITSYSTVYGQSGVMPTLGTLEGKYGTGINMNRGSIGNVGLSPNYLSGSWCVDFWVAYSTLGTQNDFLPFYPLMNDNNATGGTNLEFQCHSTAKYLSVYQSGVWLKTGNTYLNELISSNYNHFCMQFDNSTKTLYVFVNGVLKFTFTGLNYSLPTTTHNGFVWGNYASRSTSSAVIERYRIRTGMYFSNTGFSTSDSYLYPGTQL